MSDKTNLRVASFFSGIGGFDYAFEKAGCQVVFQCERDSFCRRVLRKHWPDVPLTEDINTINFNIIPEAEIWCAGFPCQDLSLANQGKRKGLEGKRSGLFTRFAELAFPARPKWIILENVPGLLNSGDGRDFRNVIETLDDLGYFVAWRVLDAKYFGTPQRRRRVFIVASYQNAGAARVLFGDRVLTKVAATGKLSVCSASGTARSRLQETNLFAIQHATIGRKPEAGPQAKGYRNDGETYTLDSRGSTDVVCSTDDGFRVRDTSGISRELDSRRARALGNAVCVHVVYWIASRLVIIERENSNSKKDEVEYACISR
ncbi:MAG: DNA (cytosine-5-)-methyltransferase [Pyrinomonadaceae bacterium]